MKLRGGVWLSLCFVALSASPAWCAHVEQLEFANATVDCPSPGAIAAELTQIAPQLRVVLGPPTGASDSALLELADDGDHYRATIAGVSRTFANPTRNCEERARTVAVFVVATLFPPFIELDTPPPVPAPPKVLPPASPTDVPAAKPLRIEVEAAGTFAVATTTAPPLVGGATFRLFVAWKYIGGLIGVSPLSSFRLALNGASLDISRIPIDLSLQVLVPRNRLEIKASLGLVLAVDTASNATGLMIASTTFVDAGIRAGAQFAYWVHPRIAPFFAIEGTLSVSPRDFVFNDVQIGSTPVGWLSVSAGIAIKIH